ncbi:hypothetical protein [Priestia megaterium]|uniref:hypothetical protein n=1 Tax=Priestia megaterium TaxID=1404 RepID=UPI00077D77F8|nr:hypothetical protein [Priestia megaterium]
MKKILLIISICLLLFMSLFIFIKRDAIFQEGNPTPYALAASKMIIKQKEIVKVKAEEGTVTYMVKQGDLDPFIKEMENHGWTFKDRDMIANRLDFEKENRGLGCGYKYYTRYYTLIYGEEM